MHSNLPNRSSKPAGRAFLVTVLATICLYFLRFGYDFGVSDQGEFLPLLLHRLQPELLGSDWFVSLQKTHLNVRSGFVAALLPVARLIPIWATVALVHLTAVMLCISAVFRLAFRASGSSAVGFASSVLIFVLTPHWTLGGNELLTDMLVPSIPAWGLALWSLVFLLDHRMIVAGLLLGLATLLQPLIGLQLATLSTALILFGAHENDGSSTRLFDLLRLAVPFLLVGSWLLVPLVYGQLHAAGGNDASVILTHFRAPHHFLPEAFPISRYALFLALTVVGIGTLHYSRDRIESEFRRFSVVLLLTIGACLALSLAGRFLIESALITKLQLFKLTVPAKAFLVMLIVSGLYLRLPAKLSERLESAVRSRSLIISVVMVSILIVGASVTLAPVTERTLPFVVRNAGPEGEAMDWIRQNTSPRDRFAIPPSMSGFRYRAERPIFVDFKAVPFDADGLEEWYRRLNLEVPSIAEVGTGSTAMAGLDRAYEAMQTSTVQMLIESEEISFFLRRTPFSDMNMADLVSLAFRNSEWWIYEAQETPEPAS